MTCASPRRIFSKNYVTLTDKALSGRRRSPATAAHPRPVLLSVEEYDRLKRRDRRVRRIEDFTAEEMEAIAKAEVPAEYAYLDEETRKTGNREFSGPAAGSGHSLFVPMGTG